MKIHFNRPSLVGKEFSHVSDAIERGQISGDGIYSAKCHRFLEEKLKVKKALLTPSCSHALEMTAILLDIKKGDEVVVPSFTFVSTANAFALRGARVVFSDIRDDTLNIDVLWSDYEDFNSKVSKCTIDKNTFVVEAEKYLKKGIKEEDRKANYSILEMYNEQLKKKK